MHFSYFFFDQGAEGIRFSTQPRYTCKKNCKKCKHLTRFGTLWGGYRSRV